ncbi:hypothetical protein C2G38_2047013 [Gigaspora rosea]|uniref:Uncharacterized protein n=1 Tax=Gigaspora rosea TaxID=44941 RepID=A0A397U7A8_9GLOM|nr:hypothetical protein C2G38_2047013 [Gigaspora rosea]
MALDALRSNPSTSIKKPQNTEQTTAQSPKNAKTVLHNPMNQSNYVDVDYIDDDIQNFPCEITESTPLLPLSESFTNTLENLSVDDENASNGESKTIKLILEMTKQILMQNNSIMEKQKALESTVTLLTNDVKALQSLQENFKPNMRDHVNEWWQKGMTQGIKNAIDNWLYPNEKIYEQTIQKELENFCPDKMVRYKKNSKWETLFSKIENSISTESCKYCGALFGSFRRAIFDHVFKKKISPTVNSESSESEIIAWKASEEQGNDEEDQENNESSTTESE